MRKTGFRIQDSFRRGTARRAPTMVGLLSAILVFASLAFSQVARPKLNGLEARKGRDIQAELARAQAELPSATKEAARAQEAVTKAQATVTAAGSALTNNKSKELTVSTGLISNLSNARNRLKQAEDRATQAQTRQAQATKRVPQVKAQLADWEAKILKTHRADGTKYKVDWASGQIKPKYGRAALGQIVAGSEKSSVKE
ncbi:MAG: hypothetical protein ABSF73_02985 [Terriglobia bacterium]